MCHGGKLGFNVASDLLGGCVFGDNGGAQNWVIFSIVWIVAVNVLLFRFDKFGLVNRVSVDTGQWQLSYINLKLHVSGYRMNGISSSRANRLNCLNGPFSFHQWCRNKFRLRSESSTEKIGQGVNEWRFVRIFCWRCRNEWHFVLWPLSTKESKRFASLRSMPCRLNAPGECSISPERNLCFGLRERSQWIVITDGVFEAPLLCGISVVALEIVPQRNKRSHSF